MKRKNAFTLIELLAVIVILAIIALIAVPTVMNIITKSQKSAFKDSAYGVIKAGELYYTNYLLEPDGMQQEVVLEFPNDIESLEIKGTVPNGIMGINTSGKIAIGLMNEKYCVTKEYDEYDITITEDIENCKMPKVTYKNGIMSSENYCIKIGNSCSDAEILSDEGIKVKVEVAQNIFYDFYVINDENNVLTLILDRNLGNKVSWGTAQSSGPVTAIKELERVTIDWDYINASEYTYIDDGGGNKYNIEEPYLMKARLPGYVELLDLGCGSTVKKCPKYLYGHLSNSIYDEQAYGYWTTGAFSSNTTHSHSLGFAGTKGYIHDYYSFSYYHAGVRPYGVRPIIELSK